MAEDDRRQTEELLGHNVYATSLAELLCEPSLELPVTIGVYSRWGSSKVHFFKRLQRKFQIPCVHFLKYISNGYILAIWSTLTN